MAASDKELGAISACVDHLESLPSQDARERVCKYLSDRFGNKAEGAVASRFAPPLRRANTSETKQNGPEPLLT